MRTVSLEKQIAGIMNNGQVLRSEEYRMHGETVEIKTIKQGSFKCTAPMDYMAELLANARRISRKKPEKYPIPQTQKILTFLYNNKKVIPFYKQLAEGKGSTWFKNRIAENFPDDAKRILNEAYYGTESDRIYAISVMPAAWEKYTN